MIPETTRLQYERQQQIAAIIASALGRLRLGTDFDAGWALIRPQAISLLQLGRAASIHAAVPYMSSVLAETNQEGAPFGALIPGAFLEAEPNGARIGTTLDAAPVKAKIAVERGATLAQAQAAVSQWMTGVGLTMLADTRRDAYQADMVQRPRVGGYVRMLNPPSCSRCVILAGKRFLWNTGFQRHPRCDCVHIPASEAIAGDFTTDPYAYFKSLSKDLQDKTFGKIEAQAIRDGADINRVVNFGSRGLGTAGGNRRFGTPYKRTLEDIYTRPGSRKFIIENLEYHGWITGPQTAGGNILGNDPLARIARAGRGRGTYSVAGQSVTTARAARYDAAMSGTRDPLNRSTMTTAERRLYDAHYRAAWAKAGYHPNSVGANSADRGLGLRPITATEAARAEAVLRKELARLNGDPATGRRPAETGVRELARILGY